MPSPAADHELVGRHRALADFATWRDRAAHGVPRVVLCGGEPGIGKTRLAAEYARMASSAGMAVAWARAHDDPGTPPFWLWRQLLREGTAGTSLDALETLSTAGPESRYRMFDAVVSDVLSSASGAGTLLVIDDAHWGDEPSLLLLRYLVRELREAALLVVVTHRTVGVPDGGSVDEHPSRSRTRTSDRTAPPRRPLR